MRSWESLQNSKLISTPATTVEIKSSAAFFIAFANIHHALVVEVHVAVDAAVVGVYEIPLYLN